MALLFVAELPLPAIVPSVNLSIGIPAMSINANLQGALDLNASFSISPPTIGVYIAALVEVEAQMTAAIGLGLPSVSFDASAAATLVASLNAAFGLLVTLEGLLSASIGLYAFTYSGVASSMGAAVTSELATQWPDGAPSSGPCNAIVLGAVSNVAQMQLASFLDGLSVGSGLVYTAKLGAIAELSLVTNAAIGQGYTAIQAQLDAALQIQASVQLTPPTLAVTLAALVKFQAFLEANIAIGPPSVQAAIGATAKLAASITAQFGLIVNLGAVLSSPGAFFCYTYAGAGNALGGALTTSLASTWGDGFTPTSGLCLAAILAATDSFTWSIAGGFFNGL